MLVKGDGKSPTAVHGASPATASARRPRLHVEQPPWRTLTPPDAVQVDVPGSAAARRRLAVQLRALPAGTSVVLCWTARGSRRRCRRFAREAGISAVREYLAVPSLYSPTCYVEDAPPAGRYFLTQVLALPRGGVALTALFAAAKVVFRAAPWAVIGAVARSRIVVGRAGATTDPPGGTGLLEVPGMRAVVLALSKDPNAKLTILLIPAGEARPALAVKVPSTESAEASIAAERRAISHLRTRLPEGLLSTIPEIKDLPIGDDRRTLVTSALPGATMTTRYHAWRHLATPEAVRADFRMAERWLSQLQTTTSGPVEPIDMHSGVVEVLSNRFAGDPQLSTSLERLARICGRLGSARMPRTAVHGDFWFGNLLVDGDDVSGVIDWESGSASGEPIRDLVRFALTYALYLDRHSRAGGQVSGHSGLRADRWGAGIEYAIDGQGWFPALFRDFIQSGLGRLGADPALWRDAALAGIAEVAATADHLDFAALHWQMFERLSAHEAAVS
jgi:aminoglycoside phosphotransferase